jgi:Xaa-Pro aminopeptidase
VSLPTPLINRDRAETVMQHFGVAAMVLADPTNIYYATGFWPQTIVMGHVGSSLAVVPADKTKPVTLITAQFLHYFFNLDATPKDSPLVIKLYTAPDQDSENAAPPTFFRSAEGGSVDHHERATRGSTLAQLEAHPAFASAALALRSVLADLGGPLATDNVVPGSLIGGNQSYKAAGPLLRMRSA